MNRASGPYTVDASVFLSAFNPQEPFHAESYRFVETARARGTPLIVPALVLPEVAGAVGRKTRNEALARRFASTLQRFPHLMLIPLDVRLAERSADLAARHLLRGSDAVYVAVAAQFGVTLVTLDDEQRRRGTKVVPTRRPGEVKPA